MKKFFCVCHFAFADPEPIRNTGWYVAWAKLSVVSTQIIHYASQQCCGTMIDADPDPGIFVIDLQGANKTNLKKKFF
jgi:hypothetical protein